MMLAFLLARAGVDVVVLEKHADFLRDFRGDTIHPSTLEVMHELGLLDKFLERPHQKMVELRGSFGDIELMVADFSRLPTRCKYVAMMPQWDFLDFLAEQGKQFPTFRLVTQTEVTDLLVDNGGVVGVRAKTSEGCLDIKADLVVAADGRHSAVRQLAELEVIDLGAPMDVLWMRLSRLEGGPGQFMGRFDSGGILGLIDRGIYWQCAFVIPKGTLDLIRERGLSSLREEIARLAPFVRDQLSELSDWNDIKLLTVTVNRLRKWYRPGLLCIGDAAHAMSPIGGVGINLAIQDAVATANLLAAPLRQQQSIGAHHLRAVQRRRELPTRLTQGMQVMVWGAAESLARRKTTSPPNEG